MTDIFCNAARRGLPAPDGLSASDYIAYRLIQGYAAQEAAGAMNSDEASYYTDWAKRYSCLTTAQKLELLEHGFLMQTERAADGDLQALAGSKTTARAYRSIRTGDEQNRT